MRSSSISASALITREGQGPRRWPTRATRCCVWVGNGLTGRGEIGGSGNRGRRVRDAVADRAGDGAEKRFPEFFAAHIGNRNTLEAYLRAARDFLDRDEIEAGIGDLPTSSRSLRSSWFAQNFSESFPRDAVMRGEVALPDGDVGEPFIDADDIADVAVEALTNERHTCQLYELSGPRH